MTTGTGGRSARGRRRACAIRCSLRIAPMLGLGTYIMVIRALIAAFLVVANATASAQAGGIDVELNKLEPVDGACRAYLVTQNLTDSTFEDVQLDVVMFDNDGIVARRLAVQIGPMARNKTSIKVFDIKNLACDDIGQMLLNDVLQCRSDQGARDDCLSLLSVSQRGNVPFIK